MPFKIEVDTKAVVLANARNELRSTQGFSAIGWTSAANFCLQNNFNYEEALKWIDIGIGMRETFTNLHVKAQLLEKKGQTKESEEVMKRAFTVADEIQLNAYGYELMGTKQLKEALEIFKMNVKKYPASWNVYDSVGEAYANNGDKKQAVENYKTALAKSPADQKTRISDILKNLEGK